MNFGTKENVVTSDVTVFSEEKNNFDLPRMGDSIIIHAIRDALLVETMSVLQQIYHYVRIDQRSNYRYRVIINVISIYFVVQLDTRFVPAGGSVGGRYINISEGGVSFHENFCRKMITTLKRRLSSWASNEFPEARVAITAFGASCT